MIDIANILADEAVSILGHICVGIPGSAIHTPGPDYINRVVAHKNRKPAVLRNLNTFYNHGRLAGVIVASGPGRRAFCRCVVCTQPLIFRSGKHN